MGRSGIHGRFARSLGARWRGVLLAGCAALALAACTGDGGPSPNAKAMKALSPQTLALISEKGMRTDSPVVVRIYKEESELEVWKENSSGEFALLKTYPICRWSGELGPKIKEGDRQAPEGFYTITPGQMNPNSSYYLSFNLGFPNAYDRAWGRTGAHLMVHGDCSSAGCYAMTDEQIQEIFALGRESFRGGQRAFQVQAYPFRMTADNMVRHRNNPNMPFWRMLKEGSDTFELTKAQPKVDVCGKRYVFNASPVDPRAKFDPSAPCPEYSQPEALQQAIAARSQEVSRMTASAGSYTPVAPVKTGKDGGMHQVFIAKLQNPELSAPGSLPAVVKPPGSDYGVETSAPAPAESIALAQADSVAPAAAASVAIAGGVPMPAPRPADAPNGGGTQMAAASGTTLFGGRAAGTSVEVASVDGSGSWLSGVSRLFGREEPAAAPAATAQSATAPNSVSMAPPASSAFSFGNLFGGGSAPQAAATTPEAVPNVLSTGAVPVPQARPTLPQAAPRAQVPRPAPTVAPSAAAPRAASQAYSTVPTPAAVSAPLYGAVPTPAAAAAGVPQLRPSLPSNGTAGGSAALPGAGIVSTGGFTTSVQ
ncbi:hypothetical protein MKI84_18350 [Ancylobacter sp. A5.8]|uniref:L,D-transpeptidase family protein n=1 Tax=Ancylobacter gelatini TaxID=2919920 RepID=UPI001F4DBBF8|nr:murein L,D-transpeptidase family protein [Ancylobacter gelatini]MCJ8144887.1 hypothetical protein [Ancylobacter gelatini]